jgi:drug/metabolite transporter (DMT)-like permease
MAPRLILSWTSSLPAALSFAAVRSYAGQLAALGTATCWVLAALSFDAAARRVGALSLSLIRLVIALGFLCLAAWWLRGLPLPLDASPRTWGWLAVSGLVGFTFGDFCLFRAYVSIGTRLSMLMMSLAPPLTAAIGWLLLGETLTGGALLGMALTVAGVAWAVLERNPQNGLASPRPSLAGLAMGFGGALGQAGGLVLSKLGMGSYGAVPATQIRVLAAILGYALVFIPIRWWPRLRESVRDRRALGLATLGAFFGPFLGVSLSLFAVRRVEAGVAASLMALTPVLILPFVVLLRRERVGLGGIAGALVAVAGVALLFL